MRTYPIRPMVSQRLQLKPSKPSSTPGQRIKDSQLPANKASPIKKGATTGTTFPVTALARPGSLHPRLSFGSPLLTLQGKLASLRHMGTDFGPPRQKGAKMGGPRYRTTHPNKTNAAAVDLASMAINSLTSFRPAYSATDSVVAQMLG